MIARPQADLLNMLPVTQASSLPVKAVDSGNALRFDAALLEAAKAMRDSAPQKAELTLVPQVKRAFEGALSELSRKPLDQLKTLAEQPQAARPETAAIVQRAALAAGLNAEETAVLQDLVPLALPRVLALKAGMQVPGTPAITMQGGEHPGPQGGNPVKAAAPADPIQAPEPDTKPGAPSPVPAPRKAAQATDSLAQAAASAPLPVLVSTRTDDGSSRNGALTLSRTEAPAETRNAPVLAQVPAQPAAARVIQVSTATQPAPAQPAAQVSVPAPTNPSPAPAPAPSSTPAQAQAPAGPPVPQSAAPAAPGPSVAAPAAPVPARTDSPAPAAKASLPQGPTALPATGPQGADKPAPAPAQAQAVLDFQFQDPSQALRIVPGSERSLAADGTWNLAPQPQPQAPAGPPQAPASVAAPSAPGVPVPPGPQAPAADPASPTQAASQPQAPANAAQVLVQAPAVAAAPAAPAAAQAVPARPEAEPARPEQGQRQATALEGFQAPQTVGVQPRREAGEGAFGGPGQGGQDPLKALVQQAVRDYAVREAVFRQVTEALREAPSTDNGRMLIRLKPAELGEVHVDLVLKDGKLSARLVASQAEVRDAFMRDLPSFKAGLESQGVVVRDISVAVRAGVADQQQQQPQPQDPQAWWRELPRPSPTPQTVVPAEAGYAALGATDQRFSALA